MFQKTVNLTPAPACAGDFASANPRTMVLAGPGGLVAGAGGVTVGRFAWLQSDGVTVLSHGTATSSPAGFVHREQQALITAYLAESGVNVPVGFPVTLHSGGDFWAKVTGSTAATLGAAVYATYADGNITIGSAATGASVTGAIGSTSTGSAVSTALTLTSLTGLVSIGDTVAGVGIPDGTTIVSQTSGTTGLAGVYVTSQATTASTATITTYGTTLNVTAVGSGAVAVGDPISGSGVPSGAVISALGTGTGLTGTYTISLPATAYAASTTVTVVAGVSTIFKAQSAAAVGELCKISTWGV